MTDPRALFDLTGRVALVTGSSQGIGLTLARGLAGAGAHVVMNGRDAAKLSAAAQTLASDGLKVTPVAFDVTKQAEVTTSVERIEHEIGPLDILVNNAGMTKRAPLEDFAAEDWHQIMRTNLDSAFFVGQAVARGMITRKRGKIVNICSVQSELGRTSIAPYAASKGALKMLTKGMCVDWAKHGLQINGLAPGYFKTELTSVLAGDATFSAWLAGRTPAGRWGNVEELVGAAIFLASEASSFVNGHILYVDGGMTSAV
jgi:gluconate 5-dehydrogenase